MRRNRVGARRSAALISVSLAETGSDATARTGSGSGLAATAGSDSGFASGIDSASGIGSTRIVGFGSASGSATVVASASASASASPAGAGAGSGTVGLRVTDKVTFVPQPDCLSWTTPLTSPASHSTLVSGSVLVMRISPKSPRWRASASGLLSSVHSSGGDLTRVRCTSVETLIAPRFERRRESPSPRRPLQFRAHSDAPSGPVATF